MAKKTATRQKRKVKSKTKEPNARTKQRRRNWKVIAIALYLTFLLLSTIPFAADRTVNTSMKDTYEYHLRYKQDGIQTHYYVERVNTSLDGVIDLVYTTKSNSLSVETKNIDVLHIYCRSMYEDECQKVFGFDPADNSNYYKWYFIEKNHLNVNIDSDHEISELLFIDTPKPYKVVVNSEQWKEGTGYFYTDQYGTGLSNVPGDHTVVDIYFKPESGTPPTAVLDVDKLIVPVNYDITFDATPSFDTDGTITEYLFDLGDGTFRGGSKQIYSYSKPGTYGVILTVRDNDYLVDHAYVNITVVESSDIPEIQGRVPNQVKLEDAPPWALDLSSFEPVPSSEEIEFYWYISGVNNSLYTLTGENNSNSQLIFNPIPDAFGSDLVTLWLQNSQSTNLTSSQPLWINLTSVNDPPSIASIPDLILHYDDPYTFNYEPYVDDKETARHELSLEIYDGYEKQYITVTGLEATFNYPQELVGENIYTTVMVSDGEAEAQELIAIQVTSDYVPKLVESLPDIWLFEGTTKYNVFDLDNYFMDPDDDSIFFSYGQSHLEISINLDHTVDISAESEWTGSEIVTFRASDPIGAIAEDSIIVTVIPVNDPPSISDVPDFHLRYNYDYRFDITPYIHDNDNTTDELRILVTDPHIRIDANNNMVIIINYPEKYLGQSIPVRLSVSDGIDSAFQDINVIITENFPPELLSPIPDITLIEDEEVSNVFDLDQYFLDIDGDAEFSTGDNKYIDIIINDDHSVDVSPAPNWYGSEYVHFRAKDTSGAQQFDLVLVTVLPVNDAPNLLPIPDQYGNESERWILDLEPFITDVDNNISELEILVDNEYVVVSGGSLIFLGSKEMPEEVQITVSDGEFSSTQNVEVHVKITDPPRVPTLMDLFIDILPFLIMLIIAILVIVGIVYKKRNKFTAEEVFLIHQGGTLITHLTRNQQANVDDIIFSGMFTAVQEFIKDTFSGTDDQEDASKDKWLLDELRLGENKILIERSENTFLAVIFSGDSSKRLRRIVNGLLADIEDKYVDILPKWEGNINDLEGTKKILSVLIAMPEVPKVPDELGESVPQSPTTIPEVSVASAIPKHQSAVKQQYPSAQQINASLKSIVSKSIRSAKPINGKMSKPVVKELLTSAGKLAGSDKPGLTAWPMKSTGRRMKKLKHRGINDEKIPIAMHIRSKSQKQKTIVVRKNRLPIKAKPAPIAKNAPNGLAGANFAKPVNVTMPGSNKQYIIDPNKSLLMQLAEMDDN